MSELEKTGQANINDADEKGYQNARPQPIKKKPWWKLGGEDYSFVSVNAGYGSSPSSSDTKLGIVDKLGQHVYEDEETKALYKPIEGYEGSHRFDPDFKWTPEEEKRLVKTLDWRIALPACIMFFALQLDRGNIVQAISDTLLSK